MSGGIFFLLIFLLTRVGEMAKKKSAVKVAKACKCLELVNKQLEPTGVTLSEHLRMNFATGKASVVGPVLAVEWKGKPVRGKRLPLVLCTYCPCCGKKKP